MPHKLVMSFRHMMWRHYLRTLSNFLSWNYYASVGVANPSARLAQFQEYSVSGRARSSAKR